MNFSNIDYILFRNDDTEEVSQVTLLTKKDNWSYFITLEPSGGDQEDLELFAKFKMDEEGYVSGFMRYHLDDEERGWQGVIEDNEVDPGEVTFMDYTPVKELNAIDKEVFLQLHDALYKLVYHDEEEDIILANDEVLELMDDNFYYHTDNWPLSDEYGWIPDEFALYYMEFWHGTTLDDV